MSALQLLKFGDESLPGFHDVVGVGDDRLVDRGDDLTAGGHPAADGDGRFAPDFKLGKNVDAVVLVPMRWPRLKIILGYIRLRLIEEAQVLLA